MNPAVCTKCSETGAEALGHNWAAATCGSPETCLRCGAQQGDALGHSYGDWSFEEDQMTHTCSVCAFEETAEIDRELYLETLLSGYWDFYASVDGEETQLAMDLVFADLSLSFGDDHSVTFTQSSLRGYKQLGRYILIVIVNLLVNYFGLKLFVEVCGIYPTPSKMIITIVTVIISFFGQKYFSFKK